MWTMRRGVRQNAKAPDLGGYGTKSFQSGLPTSSARMAMLSRLIVLRPFSTSLIHDCAKPVLFVMSCCVNLASFRALRKLLAKINLSGGKVQNSSLLKSMISQNQPIRKFRKVLFVSSF